jgi:hypothetical protein
LVFEARSERSTRRSGPASRATSALERLSLERDVARSQNPLVGTEFESLEALGPQIVRREPRPAKRVLVVGAGISGVEAARVTAARDIWETGKKGSRRRRADAAGRAAPTRRSLWRMELPD